MTKKKKKKTGRPLKFETPEKLWEKAKQYFDKTPDTQWLITGLALHLDVDRVTLLNYEKRDEFFSTIKKMKTMVESSYEKTLRKRGNAGDIFGLKNFGWTDKREVDHTTKGESFNAAALESPEVEKVREEYEGKIKSVLGLFKKK